MADRAVSVPDVLHPVGDLPAGVYWRRRALVLGALLSVVGGGSWLAVSATTGTAPETQVAASTASAPTSLAPPSLDQVVPSLAAVQTPAETAAPTTVPLATAPAPSAAPVVVPACTDDMIAVDVVPSPVQAAVGSKPTFTLVVTNVSGAPCTRTLDAALREVVLVDAAGTRVWGSNDCYPETSTEPRTLATGEAASYPVLWSGLSSQPGCTGARSNPPAGNYTVQGRLDTKVGAPTPFALV